MTDPHARAWVERALLSVPYPVSIMARRVLMGEPEIVAQLASALAQVVRAKGEADANVVGSFGPDALESQRALRAAYDTLHAHAADVPPPPEAQVAEDQSRCPYCQAWLEEETWSLHLAVCAMRDIVR